MLVAVVTPATGHTQLLDALESVRAQTHPEVEHLVVADGPQSEAAVRALMARCPSARQELLVLPYPTGRDRWNGHRIYGAAPFLSNGDHIAYLDEDNWLDPDHLARLVEVVRAHGLDWSFALRNVMSQGGALLARDDCESLGWWSSWIDPRDHLVDVNCYLLRKRVALITAPIWHRKAREPGEPEVDRLLCEALLEGFPNCGTSGAYTVNNRAGATSLSVTGDFFEQGNAFMAQRHPQGFPWARAQARTALGVP